MPEVFRLLYGCGFRISEVLKLRVRDVDLNQGIITVRQGKLRKDRLVPPALSLVDRLRKYARDFESRPPLVQLHRDLERGLERGDRVAVQAVNDHIGIEPST
jgi:integrase